LRDANTNAIYRKDEYLVVWLGKEPVDSPWRLTHSGDLFLEPAVYNDSVFKTCWSVVRKMNANLRKNPLSRYILPLFTLRWNPSIDLLIVAASWILVVGGLFTATKIVGTTTGGGLPYFFLYAILTATLFGVGIPLGWMVLIRKRPWPTGHHPAVSGP
jgi:hypothetical protein